MGQIVQLDFLGDEMETIRQRRTADTPRDISKDLTYVILTTDYGRRKCASLDS